MVSITVIILIALLLLSSIANCILLWGLPGRIRLQVARVMDGFEEYL